MYPRPGTTAGHHRGAPETHAHMALSLCRGHHSFGLAHPFGCCWRWCSQVPVAQGPSARSLSGCWAAASGPQRLGGLTVFSEASLGKRPQGSADAKGAHGPEGAQAPPSLLWTSPVALLWAPEDGPMSLQHVLSTFSLVLGLLGPALSWGQWASGIQPHLYCPAPAVHPDTPHLGQGGRGGRLCVPIWPSQGDLVLSGMCGGEAAPGAPCSVKWAGRSLEPGAPHPSLITQPSRAAQREQGHK